MSGAGGWKPNSGLSPAEHWNTKNLVSRWTRFCWWLSRKLGGRSVFGKQDLT